MATAKQYLSRIRKMDIEIKNLQSEADELRSTLSGLRSPSYGERVQTSPVQDKYTDIIYKLQSREKNVLEYISAYSDFRGAVVKEIHQLENPEEGEILYRWFVKFQKPKEIAADMDISVRNVWNKYKSALSNFEQMFSETLKLW